MLSNHDLNEFADHSDNIIALFTNHFKFSE